MDLSLILIGHGKLGQSIENMAVHQKIPVRAIFTSKNISEFNNFPIKSTDVVIENTNPLSAVNNLMLCAEKQVTTISGSTGWLDQYEQVCDAFRKKNTNLLVASNFSIAMNVFFEINRVLADKMEKHEFDVVIREKHHLHKKDAPSGTAITIANDIIEGNSSYGSWHFQEKANITHDKTTQSIPIIAIRESDVKGTHDVVYKGKYDQINMQHKAKSRDAFAEGAILAAHWMTKETNLNKKGIFTMKDVLGL